MSDYFALMAGITREQAAIATKGKSDVFEAIAALCSKGQWSDPERGAFYKIEKDDKGRIIATADAIAAHGFSMCAMQHFGDAFNWLVCKIDPTVFVLTDAMYAIHHDTAGHSKAISDCPFCDERNAWWFDQEVWSPKCPHVLDKTGIAGGLTAIYTCAEYVKCDKCDEYTDTTETNRMCAHCGDDPIDYRGPDKVED